MSAEGQPGKVAKSRDDGSGGGGGGSIQITTLNMVGNGIISVKGGSGSENGGGGGAGGRFVMNYLKSYLNSSYPAQSYDWLGNHDVRGGEGGQMPSGYLEGSDG